MGIMYEKIANIVTFTHKNKWFCCCNSCDITYHWFGLFVCFVGLFHIGNWNFWLVRPSSLGYRVQCTGVT